MSAPIPQSIAAKSSFSAIPEKATTFLPVTVPAPWVFPVAGFFSPAGM
jgi:hypothetical protein